MLINVNAIDELAFRRLLSLQPLNLHNRSVQHFKGYSELRLHSVLIATYNRKKLTITLVDSEEAAEREPMLKTRTSKRVINAIRALAHNYGFNLENV